MRLIHHWKFLIAVVMVHVPHLEKPEFTDPDYLLGYAAGLHNATLIGPWQKGWLFKPRQASLQWGLGHRQALQEQDWQPQSPPMLDFEPDLSDRAQCFEPKENDKRRRAISYGLSLIERQIAIDPDRLLSLLVNDSRPLMDMWPYKTKIVSERRNDKTSNVIEGSLLLNLKVAQQGSQG